MKRLIDYYLTQWKDDPYRQPLLMRGARQVGKTHSVRVLAQTFSEFVEINFETELEAHVIFKKNLDPERIVRALELLTKKSIQQGSTLLFFDEIQACPQAITALRYFYEKMPQLHVIAAGSLMDFAIEQVGIPVGRVQSLYMQPLSFMEFLSALDERRIVKAILDHDINNREPEMGEAIHDRILDLLGEYLALGGMPQVIARWQETKNAMKCSTIHGALLDSYRQDFGKYAKIHQIKYVELIFDHIPLQLGKKFKYSLIEGDYRKRELAPALDLLVTAGVARKVYHSAGQGIPLGAQIDPQDYKVIFLDVGLAQASQGLDIAGWFVHPQAEFVNKGSLVEAYVGQEILAYSNPLRKNDLYYWHGQIQAEVDYLIQSSNMVIPVEVKSGSGRTLQSLHRFLDLHPKSPFGIRFSTLNYSVYQKVHSYPLYAIASIVNQQDNEMKKALMYL